MTIPLAVVDIQRIFSLSGKIIECHATSPRNELLHGGGRIKVRADPK
jgi:hypothetical protein